MFSKISLSNKVLGGLIVVLLIFFGIREWNHQKNENELVKNLVTYSDSAKHYKIKVNGMEVEVAQNKSLILQSNKQVNAVLSSLNDTISKLVKKFKSIQSGTIINNYTTINNDTIRLPSQSIPCDFKPFKVRRDSIHYKFIGTIGKNFFSIDTLSIPNKISLIIGRKKTGFLRSEERAEIINSNPLVSTTNIGNYVLVSKKKRFGIGPSVGYGLQFNSKTVSLSPYIGVSANYNLIEF